MGTRKKRDLDASRPKILFVNRSYWPDAEATGQLLTQLCEGLTDTFDVTVLAGQPNANPDRKAYKKLGSETKNGVQIWRIPHTTFPKRWKIGRLINLISFLFSTIVFGIFLRKKDILVFETDPFLLPLAVPFLRLRHRCKIVFYLQDIYPDVAVALGKAKEGWIVSTLRWLLFRQYRRSDRVVVLSRDMKELCVERGISNSKMMTIPNWCDTEKVQPIKVDNPFRKLHQLENKTVIMHSGNMGLSQRLDRILEAAKRLESREDIVFLLVGGGASEAELKQQASDLELKNVRFLPYQPWDELANSLSAADVHLISVDERAIRCLMPSKLYGILASGTCSIAIVPKETELADIIRENNVGTVVAPNNIEALVKVIEQLADNEASRQQQGELARTLAEEKYNQTDSINQFHTMLFSLRQ